MSGLYGNRNLVGSPCFEDFDVQPPASAATLSSCNARAEKGVSGLTNTAMVSLPGIHSCRICSRLPTTSLASLLTPVTFPPGRFRLKTTPAPIGSPTLVKTTGIVVVQLAAFAGSVPTRQSRRPELFEPTPRPVAASLRLSIGGTQIDAQILALAVAQFTQPLQHRVQILAPEKAR